MGITFAAQIMRQEQKKDGTWNVKIRVTKDRQQARIATNYFVERPQLTRRSFELSDPAVISAVNAQIGEFRKIILSMGRISEDYSARELAKELVLRYRKKSAIKNGIDFIVFGQKMVTRLINENRDKYAKSIKFTLNALNSVYPDGLMVESLTSQELENLQGKMLRNGLSQTSVNVHLRNIRTIFNACRNEYNDEDSGEMAIRHYPFRKFRFRMAEPPRKRSLETEQVQNVIFFDAIPGGRVELARDVFTLSFCLLGMNTIDLYCCTEYDGKRITYYRHKTKARKGERAKLSVFVPEVLRPILEKYRDSSAERAFDFYTRYATADGFNQNVNKGLKAIAEALSFGEKLTTYYARHSFATIARNECGVSKDDIAMCLTHSSGHDITDIYLKEKWSIIDRAQEKVVETVFGSLDK